MRVKWLHISDIHFSYAGFDAGLARNDLIDYLHKTSEKEQFTDLFVTGDVLYKYTESSKDTIRFLNNLVETMDISKSNVWIIPGNHDHCRDSSMRTLANIYSAKNPNLAVDELTNEEIEGLLNTFMNYKDFCDQFYGNESIYEERKLHWHSFIQDNCSIIGLNTAWLEKVSKNAPYLQLGLKQLQEALKNLKNDPDAVNIAIGHHPICMFSKKTQERILELFHRNHIQLYLCGHKHLAGATYYEEAGVLQIDAAGVLIDGHSYGGYCIGTIETNQTYKVEFFKWNLTNQHWNPERSRTGVSIDGICYFDLIKQDKKPHNVAIDAKLLGTSIPDNEIYDALKDATAEIIRFSTANIAGLINEKQWEVLRNQLKMIKKTTDSKREDMRLCVFPIAPIPLLVEMGFLYQQNCKVDIWQYDCMRSKWTQYDRTNQRHNLEIKETLIRKTGALIITVATSIPIHMNQIDPLISTEDNDVIQFYTIDKQIGYPLDARIVRQYAHEIFSETASIVGYYDEIHLFLAVPAGLAMEIGRWIRSNIFRKVHLYHYQAGYHFAYTING